MTPAARFRPFHRSLRSLLFILSLPAGAAEPCIPEPLTIPLSLEKRELTAEPQVDGYGCDGVYFSEFRTAVTPEGGLKLRVSWSFVLINDSGGKRRVRAGVRLILPSRDPHALYIDPIQGAEEQSQLIEGSQLLSGGELRSDRPPKLRLGIGVTRME